MRQTAEKASRWLSWSTLRNTKHDPLPPKGVPDAVSMFYTKHETRNTKLETRNTKLETRNAKHEMLSPSNF